MHLEIPSGNFAGYIFDLDGTLIDTMPVHYRAWDEALRAAGLGQPLDEDLFYSLGGVPTRLVAERIAAHYGLKIDPDAVEREKERIFQATSAGARLIEPVVAFARRMAATHPVAIATGGLPDIAWHTLRTSGLAALFAIVITPLDVPPGRGKPAPDMFLLAAQRMGVPAEQCLVFEDASPGIQGARAAGMCVVCVPSRSITAGPQGEFLPVKNLLPTG
jgi:HAD superfamily hydrolase (TIGR01509 family)